MAISAWSKKILQLLRRMNNVYLAGSCRPNCLRFEIDGAQVGWIPPRVAPLLTQYPEVFGPPHDGAVSLCHGLDSYGKRSDAVDAVLQTLRLEGCLTCLKGWRDEKYSVMPKFSDPPLMWMERAATSLFGVKRYGVHINGYTVTESGEVRMWLVSRHTRVYWTMWQQVVWLPVLASNTHWSKNAKRKPVSQQPLQRRLIL
uniref:DUF4743 domain-containing protein n=1 Tax=Monopterus albus TaxID=43700 RepID=A0A3Q3K1I5_MONAL